MLHFLGRLHLIFLHLPISFLIVAGLFGFWSHWKKTAVHQEALHITLLLGAITAAISSGCGWLLAQDGDYEQTILEQHQWLGFATSGLAWATWMLRKNTLFLFFLTLTVLVIAITGHLGGTLTHGEGYLTAPSTRPVAVSTVSPSVAATVGGHATFFETSIRPILTEKCTKCHNAAKRKGALSLDSAEGIKKGGKHGPCVVAGQPDSSLLWQRINLPIHHEEHMPPKGRPQLTAKEIALFKNWILDGADFRQIK